MVTDGTVTGGPYLETKEVLGGFAGVDVHSREEALKPSGKQGTFVPVTASEERPSVNWWRRAFH